MPPTKTTPRRSRRFAPAIALEVANKATDVLEDHLHDRPLEPTTDLPSTSATGNEQGTARFYAKFRRKEEEVKRRGRPKKDAGVTVFSIGDTVLLAAAQGKRSGGQPAHNVGVIMQLWEVELEDEETPEDGGMYAKVHWFLRQDQLPKVRGQRMCEPNEIYYSMSSIDEALPLATIVRHCTVSPDPIPKSKAKSDDAAFVCYFATDPRRDLFYSIAWEDEVRRKGLERGEWDVVPVIQSKRGKKRKRDEEAEAEVEEVDASASSESSDEEEDEYEEEDAPSPSPAPSGVSEQDDGQADADEPDEPDEPITPSKRRARKARKLSTTTTTTPSHPQTTPRKKRGRPPGTTALPTPHSKAALLRQQRSKKQARTKKSAPVPVPSNSKWVASLPTDPHLRALATLHVSATPDELPCRREEFGNVLGMVEGLLEAGGSGCIYISGVPGTGKTATVHAVVRTLHARAEASEIPPFTYVPLNGLKLADPRQAYVELWRVISGEDKRVSANEALKQLQQWYEHGKRAGPEGGCFVVLMDELDQLITTKQDVVYNFFNWPTLPGSQLIVIAVANTMDLPERVMSGKVRSRMGMHRINFPPYVTPQLGEIVRSRLSLAAGDLGPDALMNPDAVKLACMRVGSVTGDARRVLDICRRAVELSRSSSSPSSDDTWRRAEIEDVNEVTRQMQNSPAASYLRQCSFMEKVMLVSLVKVIRREGVAEVKWGDVAYQHIGLVQTLYPSGMTVYKPGLSEQRVVLSSLVAAKVVLLEEGALAMRKGEGERKVCLGLESGEIERVLSDCGDRWAQLLGA